MLTTKFIKSFEIIVLGILFPLIILYFNLSKYILPCLWIIFFYTLIVYLVFYKTKLKFIDFFKILSHKKYILFITLRWIILSFILYLFTLYTLYFLLRKKVLIKRELFFYTSIIFSISVIFRVLDYYLCSFWHIGTHFIWHILNALTLYLLGKFYYLNSTEPPQKNQPRPK